MKKIFAAQNTRQSSNVLRHLLKHFLFKTFFSFNAFFSIQIFLFEVVSKPSDTTLLMQTTAKNEKLSTVKNHWNYAFFLLADKVAEYLLSVSRTICVITSDMRHCTQYYFCNA